MSWISSRRCTAPSPADPRVLGRPLAAPTRFFTSPVYQTIRGVTKLVGAGIDLALAQLAPLLADSARGPERDVVLAVLNGVLGDYLSESGNPLAIEMQLRHDGHPLVLERPALRSALPDAGARLLVLVHGSCIATIDSGFASGTTTAQHSRATSDTRRSTFITIAACTSRTTAAPSPPCSSCCSPRGPWRSTRS